MNKGSRINHRVDEDSDSEHSYVMNENKPNIRTTKSNKRAKISIVNDDGVIDDFAVEDEESGNSVAKETGQIIRIDVENFMCHRKFCK